MANLNFSHYLPWNLFKDPAKFNVDAVNPPTDIQEFQEEEAANAEAAVQRPVQGILASIKNAAMSIVQPFVNAAQGTIDIGTNIASSVTRGSAKAIGEITENVVRLPITIATGAVAAVGNGLHKVFALGRTAFSAGNVAGAYASRAALQATSIPANKLQRRAANLGIADRLNNMAEGFNNRIKGALTVPGYNYLNQGAAAA